MTLPVAFAPDVASEILEATRRVLRDAPQPQRPALAAPVISGQNVQWVKVDSTTVTSGKQAGKLQTYNPLTDAWTIGASVKVKQANGYVLDTGKYYEARMAGYDSNGDMVFLTDRQSGKDGTQLFCDNVGTKTETLENGVIKTIV